MFGISYRVSGFLLVALTSLVLGLRLDLPLGSGEDMCEANCCCEAPSGDSCCAQEQPPVSLVSDCGCGDEDAIHLDTSDLRWVESEIGELVLRTPPVPWLRWQAAEEGARIPSPEAPPPRRGHRI